MDDGALYAALLAAARDGRRAALATVVRTRGSVPRRAGSRMLIEPGVGLIGTIGGGCGEADVLAAADEVIDSGTPRLVHVRLMDEIESWSPAVCGGTMDVFVEPVAAARGGQEKGREGDA
jgi:xanthine/CO dehydrogenase XdhC/CoxF family maturation factor